MSNSGMLWDDGVTFRPTRQWHVVGWQGDTISHCATQRPLGHMYGRGCLTWVCAGMRWDDGVAFRPTRW